MLYMKRIRKFDELLALRLSREDLQQLEAIAKRERESVSAVIRRFIAKGLDGRGEVPDSAARKKGQSDE